MALLFEFTILLAFLLHAVTATNPCFFPNGDSASGFIPCSPNGDGDCCAEGDSCTQYGYCVSASEGKHYRGGCTDSTWGNPSCPKWCLANSNSGNTTFVNVISCDTALNTFCCEYDGNCCTASTFVPYFGTTFAEPGATLATLQVASTSVIPVRVTSTSTAVVVTTSVENHENTSTTTSSSFTSPNSSTSTNSASQTISNTPASQTFASNTSSVSVGAQASDTPASKKPSQNIGPIVGGVVAGIFALAASVGVLILLKQRKKRWALMPELASTNMGKDHGAPYGNEDSPPNVYAHIHEMSAHQPTPGAELSSGMLIGTELSSSRIHEAELPAWNGR